MHRFKNLKVWQMGMDLVVLIYQSTEKFPSEEKFGLVSQINRSAVSICSNIAEGAGRGTDKEFKNFLSIALASSFELETQLILGNRLKFISEEDLAPLLNMTEEIQKMIIGLQNKLKSEILKSKV
jgi:four helix bundle protein